MQHVLSLGIFFLLLFMFFFYSTNTYLGRESLQMDAAGPK